MTLHFYQTGPAVAPTLVFLHGGGAAGWMWRPVIEQLPEFHCLALDLPQHGRSTHLAFTMQSAAQAVAAVVRQQAHGGTAHIIGLSLGAQVLVALLSQSPEVAASAIISSALLRPLPGASLGLYSAPMAKAMYWSAIGPLKSWDAWVRLNMKYSAGIPEAFFEDFKREFRQLTPAAWTNVIVENSNFRMPAGLDKVTAPVLVLAGAGEYKVMRQSAQELVDTLPNAKLAGIPAEPGWSMAQQHNWALTAPDRFAAQVRDWVNQSIASASDN
jgi:pimeloyl-ACP methyl ester carboxylesterase